MKKNLKTLAEKKKTERPACPVNMNHVDLVEASGLSVDLRHKRSAQLSGAWKLAEKNAIEIPMGGSDFSGYAYLTFAVFAEHATRCKFRFFAKTGDACGYTADFVIETAGWNHFSLRLAEASAVGAPTGWTNISSISFTRKSGGTRSGATLYFDSFYLWENAAPKSYELISELRRAVIFSERGSYALVNGRRVPNGAFSPLHPERDARGRIWVPLGPVVAALTRKSEADSTKRTLAFTYRKHHYVLTANSPQLVLDGKRTPLEFLPKEQGGSLLVPVSYLQSLFPRKYLHERDGLIILSNRKSFFAKLGKNQARDLLAETVFARPDADELFDALRRRHPALNRSRLLFSKDDLAALRQASKEEAFGAQLENHFAVVSATPAKKLLSSALFYLATGKKKILPEAAKHCDALTPNVEGNLLKFGREAFALAAAHDALKAGLDEAQKADIERKLLRTLLRPGIAYYDGKLATKPADSPASASLHAGMIASAVAMAECYPETARKLLTGALSAMEATALSIASTSAAYLDFLLAVRMLETTFGTSCGFSDLPGVAEEIKKIFKAPATEAFLRLTDALLTK